MTKFSLSSSTYKSQIFEGLSRLQQSDEFVDMTLAAEGHLVKVHQTVVALASPYLKDMLLSIPSKHPVIFLTGISHEMLGFILEYIYRGEVEIPVEKVQLFLNCGQALHVAGLKNINCQEDEKLSAEKQTKHTTFKPEQVLSAVKANITEQNESNFELQLQEPIIEDIAEEIQTNGHVHIIDMPTLNGNNEIQNISNMDTCSNSINISLDNNVSNNSIGQKPVAKIEILSHSVINEDIASLNQGLPKLYTDALANMKIKGTEISKTFNVSNLLSIGGQLPSPQYIPRSEPVGSVNLINTEETIEMIENEKETDSVLYTVSNRGALQLIMNRFMYYCHYQRDDGHKRRWRCIDYRDLHCPATVDTVGEEIKKSKHKHCHPNHDQKIRKKISRSDTNFFPSVQMARDILENKKK